MSSAAETGTRPGLRLRVDALGVTVGGTTLVGDVRLDLEAGQVVTLIGPSGAGKSTIAMAIADALPPTHRRLGTVELAPAHAHPPRIGYLPQDAALTLNPARRIGAALGELVRLHGAPPSGRGRRREWVREQTAALLAEAAFPVDPRHLDAFVRRYPHEFSGGQRTRLALAQVLAISPDLLVLDEPSAGLDPVSRQEMAQIILRLRDRGVAVLLVTHDHRLAEDVSTRIHSVAAGRVTAEPVGCGRREAPPSPVPRTRAERVPVALEVDGVEVRHGRHPLVSEARLRVHAGELVGIVGASGAGKSTLARAVAGLVPVHRGEVLVDGVRYAGLGRRSRGQVAAVQYVWQECRESFEEHLSILDQVARTATHLRRVPAAEARREAREELAALGLEDAEIRRTPPQLSGGQLRRAALARALLARPRVLLCDELTTGLDPASAANLLDHLDQVRATTGCAVLVLSHDLRLLLPRIDRLVVLDDGTVTDDIVVGAGDQPSRSTALTRLLEAEGTDLGEPRDA